MSLELLIRDESGTKVYLPAVEEGIEWTTERKGTPGKLTFKVLPDDVLDFSEGSLVTLRDGDYNIFCGFVFKQQRDKEQIITVTAYDQLRYLKNKDIIVYEEQTADQLVRQIAADYSLQVGELEDTGYVIRSGVEDNITLFDMIQKALDITMENTGELFVLYDDFGKLALKRLSSMTVRDGDDYLILDGETGENFEYTSSIDDNTYNRIKLSCENEKTGGRKICTEDDAETIERWGILQYYETFKEGENGQAKAQALLKLYNKKTRSLKLSKVLGDNRVRAGSRVAVNLDLCDVKVRSFMIVESCKHTYKEGEHWMDLTLRGGEFVV